MSHALTALLWIVIASGLFFLALRRARREERTFIEEDVDFDDWKNGSPDQPVPEHAKPTDFR